MNMRQDAQGISVTELMHLEYDFGRRREERIDFNLCEVIASVQYSSSQLRTVRGPPIPKRRLDFDESFVYCHGMISMTIEQPC